MEYSETIECNGSKHREEASKLDQTIGLVLHTNRINPEHSKLKHFVGNKQQVSADLRNMDKYRKETFPS